MHGAELLRPRFFEENSKGRTKIHTRLTTRAQDSMRFSCGSRSVTSPIRVLERAVHHQLDACLQIHKVLTHINVIPERVISL